MSFPEYKKDIVGKVVLLKRDVRNRGGDLFEKGQLLVVSDFNLDDETVKVRPIRGSVVVEKEDLTFLGEKCDFGLGESQ